MEGGPAASRERVEQVCREAVGGGLTPEELDSLVERLGSVWSAADQLATLELTTEEPEFSLD